MIVRILVTLALVLLIAFAAAFAVSASPQRAVLPANELGRIMILEYHRIDYPEGRWTRTPENFRRDLETLYARGYRLVNLNALLDRLPHPAPAQEG